VAILALCPSRGRPQAAAETLRSFKQTARDPAARLIFLVDDDDPTAGEYPKACTRIIRATGYMGGALAIAGRDRELLADATAVGMVGDDNRFRTPGWDVIFDSWLSESPGIAYGDDGFQHERLPTSWWVSRPIVDAFGIVLQELRHYYMDNHWKELGEATGILRYFPEISIEHLHPLAGKGENDEIYRRGEINGRNDRTTFARWSRVRKPRDVARLRGILDAKRPRRVLADWHHPALWESLEILFGDRFGWELYSPIGLDWQQHGWRLEGGTPGWTATDYLSFPDARLVGDHYELAGVEYPDRQRKLVTWEQASAQRWDFVLASVPTHQRSFAELARKLRARFIHQVGNAKHGIDRGVPQITLASAMVPRGRSTIIYHQEFDTRLFDHVPSPAPRAVAALMLRLERTSCPWEWFSGARDVAWSTVGGADPRAASYLAPMSLVADLVRSSGWVWHDKRIGDGYGHVLHTAIAMGRPVIGHASHYRGQLGEPLWRDLDTCIDLDRHSEADALRLFRAITADPDWYRDVSERTANRFREVVDFDAEADEIRKLLA
jgi:hypothetical protein